MPKLPLKIEKWSDCKSTNGKITFKRGLRWIENISKPKLTGDSLNLQSASRVTWTWDLTLPLTYTASECLVQTELSHLTMTVRVTGSKSINFYHVMFFFYDCTANVAIQVCFVFCLGRDIPGSIALKWRGLILVHKSCSRVGFFFNFLETWQILVSLICNFLHRDRLNVNACINLHMVILLHGLLACLVAKEVWNVSDWSFESQLLFGHLTLSGTRQFCMNSSLTFIFD